MKKLGFTLIELLIVIALLGALAVGLLAALDPFEQLKKGTDTGLRNTVSELHGSLISYYAIRGELPWTSNAVSGTLNSVSTYIQSVIDTGELKSGFFSLLPQGALSQIYINGTTESVTVCFQPKSRSFRNDPNTKYTQYGADQSGCPSATANSCYWCVR
jgi:prepilin-type N-terminal cleavage/methylation domain-containing protein